MDMAGHYDALLVCLSIAIAIFASFTALSLANRLLVAEGPARFWWLLAAAVALGGGIWSMHFVGMLAFIMPMPVTYDIGRTLLSLALPITVVGTGLAIVNKYGSGIWPLIAAGLLAGLGVVTMHYGGMSAMRMPGVSIAYDPTLVVASVAIAVAAATAALWLAFRAAKPLENYAAAGVMGTAIAGMHYTGMAAAAFIMDGHGAVSSDPQIEPGILAVSVATITLILLLLGLMTAFFDKKLAMLTAHEAAALMASEERLRALHRNASDVVAILDRDGIISYEASSAVRILGLRSQDMIGRPFTDFVLGEQVDRLRGFIHELENQPDSRSEIEIRLQHANGSWRDMEVFGSNLLADPAVQGLVVNMRDITERNRLFAEIERLSETDLLTKTLNRRGFMKLAEREFDRARRSGEPLAFVMIDIDRFKSVNDNYGHAAGDMILAIIAEACLKHTRSIDLVARFGGEEFLVLLANASLENAATIVERLQKGVRESYASTIKGELRVTASFGIAVIDPVSVDLETAIRLADEALYEAKNSGRNCIKVRAQRT